MPIFKWSRTSNSNSTSDPTINMAEGMAPSAVNDGIRAAMAAVAMYRDDIAGAITTSGTSTAYTLSSFSVFDSLSDMNGQMIAFTPHATNGATVTLNVDGLGAKPLRTAPSTELLAGVLIQGTPYVATYNNSDGAFYLQSFFGNPYNIPLGGMLDFIGPTTPNASFAFPAGQAISRTTYATLFGIVGTTYGSGDGSTTFNVPDLTGRVTAMLEASATRLTSAGFGGNSTVLGATGGLETYTMQRSDLPNVAPTFTGASSSVSVTSSNNLLGGSAGFGGIAGASGAGFAVNSSGAFLSQQTSTGSTTANGSVQSLNGGVTQTAEKNVQPTIIVNKILRII